MTPMPIERASAEVWDRAAASDPTATFFQTRPWHQAASRHFGSRGAAFVFRAGGVEAVLPLQEVRGRLGTRFSSPFGTYTALLSAAPLDAGELARIKGRLSRLNLDLFSSPFTANAVRVGDGIPNATRVLDLAGLPVAGWESGWSRNHRRLLGAAREEGLRIREARDRADVESYHGLYLGQVARWGGKARVVYPHSLFLGLWDDLGGKPAMRLWLAEDRDGVVAGRLCFYHNRHAVEWHAAAREDALAKGANHFLIHAIVEDARARGFAWYDFNPNPGLSGVDHFKRGFGTRVLPFEGSRNRVGFAAWAARLAPLIRR